MVEKKNYSRKKENIQYSGSFKKGREQIMYDLRAARQKHKVDTGAYYAQ